MLELGTFLVHIRGLFLVNKEFNQSYLYLLVLFECVTNLNVAGYDEDVQNLSDFDNSILCARLQFFFQNSMDF